jgi:cellulose synthase/poly-beta-1,6-N-acetylglucosamine synthase-like glycosyltransferase
LCRLGDSPWSACLVEDLELGLRMHLDGVGIRYTARAVVTQQAVVDIRRLTRQRTRWAQGNLQCARYLGRLITSPKVRPTALLLGAALVYPAFLLLGLVATYRAIVRQTRGRQAWAKTERLMEEPLMEEPPQAPLEVALAA